MLSFPFQRIFTVHDEYKLYQRSDQITVEIQAYIDFSLDDASARAIEDEVKKVSNVASTKFESKEEAFNNYKERLGGDSAALDGLEEEEFLRNSVKISLTDLTLSAETAEKVSQIPGVAQVINHQETVDRVIKVTGYIQNASFMIMLILMVVSLFIISNTIKLSVASRANEIHIMKFVGATNWFIRWPFVIEGIFIGFLGSLLALGVTYLGYTPLYNSVSRLVLALKALLALFGFVLPRFSGDHFRLPHGRIWRARSRPRATSRCDKEENMKKRRLMVSVIAILVALVFILTFIASVFPVGAASLSTQLENAKNQKRAAQQELSEIQNKKKTAESDKAKLDSEINGLNQQISAVSAELDRTAALLSQKETELALAQEECEKQFDSFKNRARIMYENGPFDVY